MKLYTLGYQGLSVLEYVRILRQGEVRVVLDVRDHAWSQRPEFVKTTLRDELTSVGIDYTHTPYVGNPPAIRKQAKSAVQCLRKYELYILKHPDAIKNLYQLIGEASALGRPACLTCYERNPQHCHRFVLVNVLSALDKELEVIHLPLPNRRNLIPRTARNESLQRSAFLQPLLLPR